MPGATEDRSNGCLVDGIVLRIVGPISVLRIQRATSVGNTEESVGLRALVRGCSYNQVCDTKMMQIFRRIMSAHVINAHFRCPLT